MTDLKQLMHIISVVPSNGTMKAKIDCECGASFTSKHRWWHEKKSRQHLDFVKKRDKPFVENIEFHREQIKKSLSIGILHAKPSCDHSTIPNATVCGRCGDSVWKYKRYR
jgi:hypothetical protein